jgi:hypothetical protein
MSAKPVSPVTVRALVIVAACVVCIPAIAADSVKFDAGLWQHTNRVSLDVASWQPAEQRKTCLSEAETTSWDAQVREQIARAHCATDRLSVADGQDLRRDRVSGRPSTPGKHQREVHAARVFDRRDFFGCPRHESCRRRGEISDQAVCAMAGTMGRAMRVTVRLGISDGIFRDCLDGVASPVQ